jgi:hypothetical protein
MYAAQSLICPDIFYSPKCITTFLALDVTEIKLTELGYVTFPAGATLRRSGFALSTYLFCL